MQPRPRAQRPVPFFFGQIFGFRNTGHVGAGGRGGHQPDLPATRSIQSPATPRCCRSPCTWTTGKSCGGSLNAGDNYTTTRYSKSVQAQPDGIPELNMYPGAAAAPTAVAPGNFGTVDLGGANNSTTDISRQIREGLSAEDLAYFGGELKFNSDGVMQYGRHGPERRGQDDLLSSAVSRGHPAVSRTCRAPATTPASPCGPSAGVRVMHVQLTGAMKTRALIIQPAVVNRRCRNSQLGFRAQLFRLLPAGPGSLNLIPQPPQPPAGTFGSPPGDFLHL